MKMNIHQAKAIYAKKGIANFTNSSSWCSSFRKWYQLCMWTKTQISQKMPVEYEEQVVEFRRFVTNTRKREYGFCVFEYENEKALFTMDKFAAISEANLRVLCNETLIQKLYSLEEHKDVYVHYFALKNLGRLCSLPAARAILLSDEKVLPHYVSVFIKSHDIIILDLTSCILAQLTMEHNVCEALLNTDMFKALLTNSTSNDPDVSMNSLQVTVNILEDPLFAREFAYSPAFTFVPFLKLLHSEYPEIQVLAIQVIQAALNTGRDQALYQTFIKSGGFSTLMDVIEMYEWKDIHDKLLAVLETSVDTTETAQSFFKSGYVDRLSVYLEGICDSALVKAALAVVYKVAQFEEGRKTLHEAGVDAQMGLWLQEKDPGLLTKVCQTLPLTAMYTFSRNTIVDANPVKYLIMIIQNDKLPPEVRITATFCLSELAKLDKRICSAISEFNRHELMICLLKLSPGKIPMEMSINLVMCLKHMSAHPDIREVVLESAVIDALLCCLRGENIQLRISTCYALMGYISESSGRDAFLLGGGERTVLDCLKHSSLSLRQAAASLIQVTACDIILTKAFIFAGALQWLLDEKQQGAGFMCPSWSTAIESLFSRHLPSKFAYRKRLDLQDITTEGFYATQCVKEPFPVLEELLMLQVSPITPIYVANFALPGENGLQDKRSFINLRRSDFSAIGINFHDLLFESFGRCSPDPYLPQYLQKLQAQLAESDERSMEFTTENMTERHARILAVLVYTQMCGSDPNEMCSSHILELHLNELKVKLGSNVIPLGYLRVGLHLERALLFKVLADRIGLPCALVRGEYRHAWVELAMPRQLRTNVVVDLMNNIGRLIPIDTYDAYKYCNIPV